MNIKQLLGIIVVLLIVADFLYHDYVNEGGAFVLAKITYIIVVSTAVYYALAMDKDRGKEKEREKAEPTDSLQKLYLKSHGRICPHCGGNDVETTGTVDTDSDWHKEEVGCNDCKATWDDVYTLQGFENVKPRVPQ